MIIEDEIILEYKTFMRENSMFGEMFNVFPTTPKNEPKFPCAVLKDISDTNYNVTLNKIEYIDTISFQLDLYSKDIIMENKKYPARQVINELRELTYKFFLKAGFNRDRDTRGETRSVELLRRTMIYSANISSWNKNII